MPRLGYRKVFGVLVPSTNVVVEPELYAMAPPGVTLHAARIYIADPAHGDDAGLQAVMAQVRESIAQAVREVMTCRPDALIMGMSSETFWGGINGNVAFRDRIKSLSGLDIATGASASEMALRVLGVRRVAVLTPYQPLADAQVRQFLEESGYDVVTLTGLRCPTAVSIADVDESTLRQALVDLSREDADAILQVGTNLPMARLADEAERWLGKPVIAINAATLWYALRQNGIADQLQGFGRLLREF